MQNSDSVSDSEVDQHSSESIAFKEHHQCTDDMYVQMRNWATNYLLEHTDWGDYVDLGKVELRRYTFEDGVISFDATHPGVVHEDELDIEVSDVQLEFEHEEHGTIRTADVVEEDDDG